MLQDFSYNFYKYSVLSLFIPLFERMGVDGVIIRKCCPLIRSSSLYNVCPDARAVVTVKLLGLEL